MITSAHNSLIKHIKKLNRYSKTRHSHQQCIIETQHVLDTFIEQYPTHIHQLIGPPDSPYAKKAHMHNLPFTHVEPTLFKTLPTIKTGCMALAIINTPQWSMPTSLQETLIAITHIQNPSNLGAILRNAHAFNANAILLIGSSCDPFHPDAIRASAGHMMTVPIINCTEKEAQSHLQHYECYKIEAKSAQTTYEFPQSPHQCYIFGGEKGFTSSMWDDLPTLSIPMTFSTESLNLSVATGILLYESQKARQLKSSAK